MSFKNSRDVTSGGFWSQMVVAPWRLVRLAGAPLLLLILAFNVVISVLVLPVLSWLFQEALRADGMVTLDLQTLRFGWGLTLTGILLLIIILLAAWAVALQLVMIASVLFDVQSRGTLSFREIWGRLKDAFRRLVRPSSLPFLAYLLIVLPLTGFGFLSVLERYIAIPPFITGELMKTPLMAWILRGVYVLLVYLNARFALSVVLFARTEMTGREALAMSWQLTRKWNWLLVVVGVAVTGIIGVLALALVGALMLAPTALADAVAPAAAATVAGISAGFAEVLIAVVFALVSSAITAWMVLFAEKRDPSTVGGGPVIPVRQPNLRLAWGLVGALVVVAVGSGITWVPVMKEMSEHPQTLVISHRGYVGGGVENTISALEAAKEVGADLVEMDVMQTKDGKFVVMHDPNLKRLTGENVNVKDLTQAELTQMTVHDTKGHTDTIPSLEEYVKRADELEMPLLLEIKMGGLDSPDHVEKFVAEMERLGGVESHIYHTLDLDSVETLKRLRPNVTAGYIMPVAGEGVPDTAADFLVVEQEGASTSDQSAAAGAGYSFFVWTVDKKEEQREYMRRHVDALITDKPDTALASRAEMDEEGGMARTLLDAMWGMVGAG